MKCPFRIGDTTIKTQEIEQTIRVFGECYGRECPYYHKTKIGMLTTEGCKAIEETKQR